MSAFSIIAAYWTLSELLGQVHILKSGKRKNESQSEREKQKQTSEMYYYCEFQFMFRFCASHKRNREQKIRISIYQKLCIPQYMISYI